LTNDNSRLNEELKSAKDQLVAS